MLMLKSQDIVVVMKILSKDGEPWSQGSLAQEIGMSASEVNAAIRRASTAGLLRVKDKKVVPVKTGLEEFLVHGLKYVFPAERGEPTRGLATGYAAEFFRSQFVSSDELPPVWADAEGTVKGYALKPLYKCVPYAVKLDKKLYEYLALIDILRCGRVREVQIAKNLLHEALQTT